MQCIKRRFSKQLLLERFYSEKTRLLNLYCQEKQNLESITFDNTGNLKQSRNLGINCFKEKANLGSGYLIADYSTRLRKLNAIKQGRGTTQIRSYLLNDYGRREGSPGGYGSSPKNRF